MKKLKESYKIGWRSSLTAFPYFWNMYICRNTSSDLLTLWHECLFVYLLNIFLFIFIFKFYSILYLNTWSLFDRLILHFSYWLYNSRKQIIWIDPITFSQFDWIFCSSSSSSSFFKSANLFHDVRMSNILYNLYKISFTSTLKWIANLK